MKIITIILIIIGALILIALIFLWNAGIFQNVNAQEKAEGGFKVVGMEYTGAYKNAGKFMTDVDKKLRDVGVVYKRGFGIYYDDPKTTPSEKCRSFVGGILEEKDFDKIPFLQSKGFKVDSVPLKSSVVVEFPIESNMSFMIGPMKAYPVLSKYMSEKGYKPALSLEIYDMDAKKIFYVMQY